MVNLNIKEDHISIQKQLDSLFEEKSLIKEKLRAKNIDIDKINEQDIDQVFNAFNETLDDFIKEKTTI